MSRKDNQRSKVLEPSGESTYDTAEFQTGCHGNSQSASSPSLWHHMRRIPNSQREFCCLWHHKGKGFFHLSRCPALHSCCDPVMTSSQRVGRGAEWTHSAFSNWFCVAVSAQHSTMTDGHNRECQQHNKLLLLVNQRTYSLIKQRLKSRFAASSDNKCLLCYWRSNSTYNHISQTEVSY